MNTTKDENSAPLDNAKWLEKAKWRKKNRKWLRYSNKIALRVLACIEDNPGMNQGKLAEMLSVSKQQVNKIVQGKENLTLETIGKLSDALGFELITFPEFKYSSQGLLMSSSQKIGATLLTSSPLPETQPMGGYLIDWNKVQFVNQGVIVASGSGIVVQSGRVNIMPDEHFFPYQKAM